MYRGMLMDKRDIDQLDSYLNHGTRHSYRSEALSQRMARQRQRWSR